MIAIGARQTPCLLTHRGASDPGDGSDLTSSEERRLGDRIIRELYRDPDYIDDPVIGEYVQGIWQPLMAAGGAGRVVARAGRALCVGGAAGA